MTRSLALALLATSALVPSAALAQSASLGAPAISSLPTGGEVVGGQATIGTPQGGAMRITQTSDRAIINWQAFSIGKGERVDIDQPGATSALLNRVTGTTTSEIAGQLNANGRVFLVNPNGILVTATGSVNAAGFTASTLDIADKDFMAGSDDLTVVGHRPPVTIGRAKGGYAGLLGGRMPDRGLIAARITRVDDETAHAALDLTGDGFMQVGLPAAGITVAGTIDAHEVVLTAGTAREAARGTVNLTGTIRATGVGTVGGVVTLTGETVNLAGATIDASGANGGGAVTIGGGAQGGGPLAHATTVSVDAASTIRADATGQGNGGNVVLWSDDATRFAGTISAVGTDGGDGGEAEVSGRNLLDYTGTTDLRGARWGTLLLDPRDITIASVADSNHDAAFTATGDDSVINSTTLVNALATANVTVSTGAAGSAGGQAGNIRLRQNAPLAWTSSATLTLQAAGNIMIEGDVTAAAGGLTLNAGGIIGGGGSVAIQNSDGSTSSGANEFGAIAVARFTLVGGAWSQLLAVSGNNGLFGGNDTFQAGDFRITGGSFLRFNAGNGSTANPYQLTDVYGLQGMATVLGANYALANDIDAKGTAAWNGGAGFRPIGSSYSATFNGSLSGGGHTISGLTIRSTGDFVGLFGAIGGTGAVTDLGLVGGSVSGGLNVGALVGANNGGTISRSYATTTVSGGQDVGGLAGLNASGGFIRQSYATGTVTGTSNVGGLVGYLTTSLGGGGRIIQSYAGGSVSASSDNAGGLVGRSFGSSIEQSYAVGDVTGDGSVGGLAGSVTNSSLRQSYASGSVSGSSVLGGLAGYAGNSNFTDMFWDVQTTGRVNGIGGDQGGNVYIVNGVVTPTLVGGLTTAQARSSAAYAGFDFTGTWYQAADLRPILRSEANATDANGVIAVGNLHQLQLMGANLSASYTLTRDIDATETTGAKAAGVFGAGGFVPVGDNVTPFSGALAGNGHVIAGLTITRAEDQYVGLFGRLSASGRISAVGLVGGSVAARRFVGGLAGYSEGSIDQSFNTGAVSSPRYDSTAIGGLVGFNSGTISRSYATGRVIGSGPSIGGAQYTGGLVGQNSGRINGSFATGTVSGESAVGGLVGQSTGPIAESYATGNVSGLSRAVGGLIGLNGGAVTSVYAIGAVSGSQFVGGLIGTNGTGGSVLTAYASGAVTGQINVGGLVGQLTGTSILGAYWDRQTTGQAIATGNAGTPGGTTGLTSAQARTSGAYAGFDFTNDWYQADDLRPILRSEANAAVSGVTAVTNLHQLQLMGANLAGSYRLSNDIDASLTNSTAASSGIWGAGGFVPLGSSPTIQADAVPFTGVLNGASLIITGLVINRPSSDDVGLIAYLGEGATVTDIGLVGGSIAGAGNVGGLVGVNRGGSVSRSHANLNVAGDTYVGGLVGANRNTANRVSVISQSYATGVVSGNGDYVGGLTGGNGGGLISQSYSSARVSGDGTAVGGLVGVNFAGGSISQSYATGNVSGVNGDTGGLVGDNLANSSISLSYAIGSVAGSNVGGLAGRNIASAAIINAYWDTQTTGQSNAVGVNQGTFSTVSGRTTAQMQDVTAFRTNYAGFDFDTVWSPPSTGAYSSDGQAHYPELYALSTVIGVTPSGTRTYGDANTGTVARYTGERSGDFVTTLATINGPAVTADVGIYGATASGAAATSPVAGRTYRFVYVPGTVAVTPATLTVGGASGVNKTYDSTAALPAGANPVMLTGVRNNDTITSSYASAAYDSPNAGARTIQVNDIKLIGMKAGNYVLSATAVTASGTISPATITVAGATGVSKTYDGTTTLPAGATGFTAGGIYASDANRVAVSAAGAAYDSANAGARQVLVNGLALSGAAAGNYVLSATAVTGSGTISPALLTYVATAASRSYGAANPVFGGTVTGFVADQNQQNATTGTLVFTSPATGGSNVGGYAINGSGLTANNGNYVFRQAAGNASALSILPASLTIGGSRTYDTTTGFTTGQLVVTGAQNGETVTLTAGSGQTPSANVGSYAGSALANLAIAVSGGNARASNYALPATGTLAITPATVTVTGASGVDKTYDGTTALPTGASGFAASGIFASDAGRVTVSAGSAAYDSANAGMRQVLVNGLALSGAAAGNYALSATGVTGSGTISPATLTYVANVASRSYGAANPVFGGTVTGFVAGQNQQNATTGTLAFTSPAAGGSNVGSYAINGGGLAANNGNYVFQQAAGNATALAVTPYLLTVGGARPYDGTTQFATGALTVSPGVNGETVTLTSGTGTTTSANVGTYAGSALGGLAIAVGGGNARASNYALPASGTLTIGQRPVTVTADPLSRIYGDANPALTYTATNLVAGETLNGALATAATPQSNVGRYAITQGTVTTAANANYAITYQGADLTVTQRALTVAADAKSRVYGDANPALTYQVGGMGLANGDALNGMLATAATPQSNVGAYAITQGSLMASGNYALTYNGANLLVTQRALTVTPDAISRVYGNATPARGTATADNLVNGDTVTSVALATPATVASGVGGYALSASDAAGTGLANYAISYATRAGGLTITPRALTVVADARTRVYGDANPALTYTLGGLGLVNGDALSGALATAATATSDVGGYAIGQGSLAATANYQVTYTGATLTVTPRPLTVTAGDQSRFAGEPNPALTFTVTGRGLVNGDLLTGGLVTAATQASVPGAYPILQGSLAATPNYRLTYVPGTLLVGASRFVPLAFRAGTQQRDTFSADTAPANDDATLAIDAAASGTLVGEDAATQPTDICPKDKPCRRP